MSGDLSWLTTSDWTIGIVQPKINILASFSHSQVVPNLYKFLHHVSSWTLWQQRITPDETGNLHYHFSMPGSLDHRRGSQIWFMICCLMARALALRGDQMTFSTGACQGRNGECTITTAWRREWERPPVLLRLNGGEMLLKSDGKMIPVNTAKGGGWSADTDDVMLREFWSLGKAANCFIKHIETMTDAEMQSNDLDVISCIISPNLSSTRRHESSIVSEVDMMVSTLNEECWLTWAWKLLRTGETISNTS